MSRIPISPELYNEWKARFAIIMQRYGFSQDAEDVLQAYCLRVTLGKSQHQTLDQFAIDYLRSNYGDARSPSHELRKAHRSGVPHERTPGSGTQGDEADNHIDARKLHDLADHLGDREQIAYRMMASGRTLAEVGEALGMTESGAGLMWKRIREDLRARSALRKVG